ncbi:septum formation initiator family protein [Metasolibacillus meyeri]|uniref:Septum formation initiator family protein n=1 Tax=Metasolibacillus meyeri TaxID=1071052 RepID=A0AAW9NV98_9BACL|nr:septum formation initiator family protein [Metasolibacillus meyeri]MEC1180208.1 septum formation initiator family protein [Metasolibacillus meyeri]
MAQRNRQEPSPNRVRKLDNDYIRSSENNVKHKPSKQQLIRRRRRMLAFFAVASVIIFSLASMLMKQYNHLEAKEQKKAEVLAELEQIQEVQEMLKLQIAKLEDDEYIAKLARKEHFMSEEGEIIFTIPKGGQSKEQEQDDE